MIVLVTRLPSLPVHNCLKSRLTIWNLSSQEQVWQIFRQRQQRFLMAMQSISMMVRGLMVISLLKRDRSMRTVRLSIPASHFTTTSQTKLHQLRSTKQLHWELKLGVTGIRAQLRRWSSFQSITVWITCVVK